VTVQIPDALYDELWQAADRRQRLVGRTTWVQRIVRESLEFYLQGSVSEDGNWV